MEPITDPKYFFGNSSEFPYPEVFEVNHVWESLYKKNEILKQVNSLNVSPKAKVKDSFLEGPIFVGDNTVINPGTVIEASLEFPVYIGENCIIGPHAHVRHGTIIGNNSIIGNVEIKNSIVQNRSNIVHTGYIGDSIIGYDVNAAGFGATNLKHTREDINVGRINTRMKKFGCVVGDYSRLTTVISYPGSLIGPNVWAEPGAILRGFVPANTFRRRVDDLSYRDDVLPELFRKLSKNP